MIKSCPKLRKLFIMSSFPWKLEYFNYAFSFHCKRA